jgi:hypothetical protein
MERNDRNAPGTSRQPVHLAKLREAKLRVPARVR